MNQEEVHKSDQHEISSGRVTLDNQHSYHASNPHQDKQHRREDPEECAQSGEVAIAMVAPDSRQRTCRQYPTPGEHPGKILADPPQVECGVLPESRGPTPICLGLSLGLRPTCKPFRGDFLYLLAADNQPEVKGGVVADQNRAAVGDRISYDPG